MKVYVGKDKSELAAVEVACRTISQANPAISATLLCEDALRATGLYTRITDKRGQPYDFPSHAPCSTEFATSRFLTPILAQSGWALFMDCDVVVYSDLALMLSEIEPGKAVYVVKHEQIDRQPKMGGLTQTAYARKNWSSVMLFDCDHPANRRLSLRDVNERPGRDLHAFYWLHDDEIGELSRGWNWLVGLQSKPDLLHIAHFTLGGPWIEGWKHALHDDLWLEAAFSGG